MKIKGDHEHEMYKHLTDGTGCENQAEVGKDKILPLGLTAGFSSTKEL